MEKRANRFQSSWLLTTIRGERKVTVWTNQANAVFSRQSQFNKTIQRFTIPLRIFFRRGPAVIAEHEEKTTVNAFTSSERLVEVAFSISLNNRASVVRYSQFGEVLDEPVLECREAGGQGDEGIA